MKNIVPYIHKSIYICIAVLFAITSISGNAVGAGVVQRGSKSTAKSVPPRASNTGARTIAVNAATAPTNNDDIITETESVIETPTEQIVTDEPTPAPIVIENKSRSFDNIVGAESTGETSSNLAESIRRQRAAIDAADAVENVQAQVKRVMGGQNTCDRDLRKCMQNKCGTDFVKCGGDTDMAWGDKLDACRRDTQCSGTEYKLFGTEIKADRDMNARLANYNKILDCGNNYNDCIVKQCGVNYNKCLGKKNGDAAISACEKIAKDCTQHDNGLSNRTMQVFATLRQNAEVQIKTDEKKLYTLRDKMSEQCRLLGAMFDDRTMNCVYSINFWANNSETPYASKKAYAGNTFDCNQNWFGIDITTFKENAYRLTREQTSATSALMGAGLGIAAGAVSSGAIGRAMDRAQADKELKAAKGDDQTSENTATKQTENNKTSNKNESRENSKQRPAEVTGNENSGTETTPSTSTTNKSSKATPPRASNN